MTTPTDNQVREWFTNANESIRDKFEQQHAAIVALLKSPDLDSQQATDLLAEVRDRLTALIQEVRALETRIES